MSGYDQPDVNRLLKALRHQEADRIPHLEFWVTSQTVFEYVLEKKLDYEIVDAALGGQSITPEDHVEFAARLGMVDHAEGWSILDRTGRILSLQLGQHQVRAGARQPLQTDQRGVANQVFDGGNLWLHLIALLKM